MRKENNELIAKFLGWYINIPSTFPTYLHQEEETQGHWELKFNTDWNWLINGVEKIETIEDFKYDFYIRQGFAIVIDKELKKDIIKIYSDTKINAVYIAVVEFIKYYNELNK